VDEYDSYALHVFGMLNDREDALAIADYLNWVVTAEMKLTGNLEHDREIAGRAVAICADS
jgi:hypothetical protein